MNLNFPSVSRCYPDENHFSKTARHIRRKPHIDSSGQVFLKQVTALKERAVFSESQEEESVNLFFSPCKSFNDVPFPLKRVFPFFLLQMLPSNALEPAS